jgi:hypothetical protein
MTADRNSKPEESNRNAGIPDMGASPVMASGDGCRPFPRSNFMCAA